MAADHPLNMIGDDDQCQKSPSIFYAQATPAAAKWLKAGRRNISENEWNVYSAGIEAHGLNPNAVKAMREAGIDISEQTSDIIDPDILHNADLVITLCGDAADKCPMTPPHVKR